MSRSPLQFDLSRQIDGAVADTLRRSTRQLPTCRWACRIRRRSGRSIRPIPRSWCLGYLRHLPLTAVNAYAKTSCSKALANFRRWPCRYRGTQQPTVRVQVDPRLGRSRHHLEDVRTVLGQANVDLPKGTLNSPRQTYTLNTNDQLLNPIICRPDGRYRNGAPVPYATSAARSARPRERSHCRLV